MELQFRFSDRPLLSQKADTVAVPLFEGRRRSPSAEALDGATEGWFSEILKRERFGGKVGELLLLPAPPRLPFERIVAVGFGKRHPSPKAFRKALNALGARLRQLPTRTLLFFPIEVETSRFDLSWRLRQTAIALLEALYRFDRFKSRKEPAPLLRQVVFPLPRRQELLRAAAEGEAIASGTAFCRELANLPPNVCTPSYLAEQARALAEGSPAFSVEVLEEADMEALGMGALLAVSRGSREPPKLIVLSYRGAAEEAPPIVLVGKGITFDAGGISLKPAQNMDEMKFDMCGAAAVLGALRAAAQLELPLNLVAVVPSCENLPDGRAYKPGDILKTMSGQTVEVLNTDAEGRLILADALTYSERFRPRWVVDVATLTGACVVALGRHASGLLGNHEPLTRALHRAGEEALDPAWPLPLWEEYDEQLKSPVADMANIGGREAGAITAACFLGRFARRFRWAHLDIAGTAYQGGKEKGATGRPVPLLVHFLLQACRA